MKTEFWDKEGTGERLINCYRGVANLIHLTVKGLNKTGCVNERINVLRVHVPDRLTEMLVGYNDWNASAKLISVVNDLSLVYLADSITAMESGIGIVASSPPNRRYLREEKN